MPVPELPQLKAGLFGRGGGPPKGLKTRPTGVPGLKEKYGLTFREFKPMDAGGPLTLNALTGDQISGLRT